MPFSRTPGLQEASQKSEMEGKMNSQDDAKQVVMSCVNAINQEDFKKARQYVSDDISFVGAMGSGQGADVYFKDMERMRLKYNIKKVFADAKRCLPFLRPDHLRCHHFCLRMVPSCRWEDTVTQGCI